MPKIYMCSVSAFKAWNYNNSDITIKDSKVM